MPSISLVIASIMNCILLGAFAKSLINFQTDLPTLTRTLATTEAFSCTVEAMLPQSSCRILSTSRPIAFRTASKTGTIPFPIATTTFPSPENAPFKASNTFGAFATAKFLTAVSRLPMCFVTFSSTGLAFFPKAEIFFCSASNTWEGALIFARDATKFSILDLISPRNGKALVIFSDSFPNISSIFGITFPAAETSFEKNSPAIDRAILKAPTTT